MQYTQSISSCIQMVWPFQLKFDWNQDFLGNDALFEIKFPFWEIRPCTFNSPSFTHLWNSCDVQCCSIFRNLQVLLLTCETSGNNSTGGGVLMSSIFILPGRFLFTSPWYYIATDSSNILVWKSHSNNQCKIDLSQSHSVYTIGSSFTFLY